MSSHGSSSVDKIKERLGIEEVVSSYIKLEKAGKNLKGRCPFHNEKTASFFVSPERNSFYCFGCNAKGDIFTFVEQFEGLDFMGALKLLAERAGIKLEFDKNSALHKTEKEKLLAIMEESTIFFESGLKNSKEAQEYIKNRGINAETIKNFRLGFVPNEWRLLYNHLKSKKYLDIDIEKAGLAKRPEGADGQKAPYDRFRGRIMFPISDSGGRVIAFSGRILVDDEKSAKYLNSPDTMLFNKSTVLYGIDKAKSDIRTKNYSILVEGQMDLVLSHQAGIRNTVAVSGTALSDTLMSRDNVVNNLGIVKRLSNNLILAFDSDPAGRKAALRSAAIALGLGMDVKIAKVLGGKDPADLVKENPELWRDTLRNSKPVVESVLDDVLSQKLDPRKLPLALRDNVFPFIAPITGAMEKAHYVRLIKEKTGLPEESIVTDLKKVEALQKSQIKEVEAVHNVQATTTRLDSISRKLFGLLLYLERNKISGFDVTGVYDSLHNIVGQDKYDHLVVQMKPFTDELLLEAEIVYGSKKDDNAHLKKDLDELLLNFEEDVIRQEFAETMAKLAFSEKNKDDKGAEDLIKKCQVLSIRISQLSKKKFN
ncbi:MAG: DNA primase [Patescibacteria group bacterium]